jgi:ABC-type proline/glycine betaine transport system permease subunit
VEDYAAAAVLIGGVAGSMIMIFRTVRRRRPRFLLAGGVLAVALAIWALLAVGLD